MTWRQPERIYGVRELTRILTLTPKRAAQLRLALDEGGLEKAANATLVTGLVRPPAPPIEQAETWFERASEWDNDPAHWQDAIEAYRRVVAIDPRYAAAWNNLGLLLHRLRGYDEAGGAYPSPLEHHPRRCEGDYQLGKPHPGPGLLPEAIADYREALE